MNAAEKDIYDGIVQRLREADSMIGFLNPETQQKVNEQLENMEVDIGVVADILEWMKDEI